MAEKVELLIENCRQVLFPGTAEEGDSLLESGSVAVADGKIVAVGPAEELHGRYKAKQRIDGSGRMLTPGFVDSHTHLVFGGDRSQEFAQRCQGANYEDIAAAGGGIRASVRATRQASEEELFESAQQRAIRMLSLGTTTIEIKSGYGLDLETELKMLRVIRRLSEELPQRVVATFLGAHEIPDEFREHREDYLDILCEKMIPAVAGEGLATFCDVFCERSVYTPEESTRILRTAQDAGLQAKIHADEMAASGGSRVAAEVGAVSADHLMMIDDEGIAGLKEAGVVPTLLPGTTFFLGKETYAPARKLLDAGLPVALATDRNPGSCTLESMAFIVGLACLRMKMTPLEAFRGATEFGARALGLESVCGRLGPGLAADMILWDRPDTASVVYEFENILPRTVFIGGRSAFGMALDRRGRRA